MIGEIESAPPFVPVVTSTGWENEGWSFDRFLVFVLGEIPTLAACGPSGQGFINRLDIPSEKEAAWDRLVTIDPNRLRGLGLAQAEGQGGICQQ